MHPAHPASPRGAGGGNAGRSASSSSASPSSPAVFIGILLLSLFRGHLGEKIQAAAFVGPTVVPDPASA